MEELLKQYNELDKESKKRFKNEICNIKNYTSEWEYLDMLDKRVSTALLLQQICDSDGNRIYSNDDFKSIIKFEI